MGTGEEIGGGGRRWPFRPSCMEHNFECHFIISFILRGGGSVSMCAANTRAARTGMGEGEGSPMVG